MDDYNENKVLKAGDADLYKFQVPIDRNYPDIDSLISKAAAFQVTINEKHPFNYRRTLKLKNEHNLQAFIYVLPESRAINFNYQNPKTLRDSDAVGSKFIEQYCLVYDPLEEEQHQSN